MNIAGRQLSKEIVSLSMKIINAGRYINGVCEGIPEEGIITYDDVVVINDPVEKADDIIKTAHDIKELAIKYQALTKLEGKVFQNKIAINNPQDPTQAVIND